MVKDYIERGKLNVSGVRFYILDEADAFAADKVVLENIPTV